MPPFVYTRCCSVLDILSGGICCINSIRTRCLMDIQFNLFIHLLGATLLLSPFVYVGMGANGKSLLWGPGAKIDSAWEIVEAALSEGGILVLNDHVAPSIFCSDAGHTL